MDAQLITLETKTEDAISYIFSSAKLRKKARQSIVDAKPFVFTKNIRDSGSLLVIDTKAGPFENPFAESNQLD